MPSEHLAPLLAALRDLRSWLEAERVSGVVIGGVAASLLGRPRATRDIDAVVLLDASRWDDFFSAAERFGFLPRLSNPIEFARENRVLLLKHGPSGIDVDIAFGSLPFEEEVIRRASTVTIGGVAISLASPEDIIIMKAVAHRPRDMADIEAILAARPDIDITRVRQWLADFSALLEVPEILDDIEKMLKHIRKN